MKTLVILSHPSLEKSVINKSWAQELKNHPDQFTVRHLETIYPNSVIDIAAEQALVEQHGKLVLQFPLYWFNCPPMMKKWLDEVLTYGWAYGSQGKKLQNRKVALAVSAGVDANDYSPTGRYHYTLTEILRPFELSFSYCHADYRSFFAFYGTERAEDEGTEYLPRVAQNAKDYVTFIKNM